MVLHPIMASCVCPEPVVLMTEARPLPPRVEIILLCCGEQLSSALLISDKHWHTSSLCLITLMLI